MRPFGFRLTFAPSTAHLYLRRLGPPQAVRRWPWRAAPVARRIFQTWKSKSPPATFKLWAATWIRMHPRYAYELWDDDDNRTFIAREFPWFLERFDAYPRTINRVDAVRYFYLYRNGGIYADLDAECVKSFEPLMRARDGCDVILGQMGHDPDFRHCIPNALMIARVAYHLFWVLVLKNLFRPAPIDRARKDVVEQTTGPVMLRNCVLEYGRAKRAEDLLQDDAFRQVLDLLGVPFERLRAGPVGVLKPDCLFPIDWHTQEGQQARQRFGPGTLDDISRIPSPEELQAAFPNSFAVNYWMHTW